MIWWAVAGVRQAPTRRWLPVAVVVVACFAIYGTSIRGGTFQYDDLHSIVGNQRLRTLAEVPSYFTDPGTFSSLTFGGMFRPLVLISYALTHAVAGESSVAYHAGNVVIHALAGILVTTLLARLGAGTIAATLGGLWFVCHPVNTEAAVYVSSRSESMCTVFLLIGLHLWLGGATRSVGDWRLVAGPIAFALALLSKSVGIIFPALLLLYDVGRGRVPWREEDWWLAALWRHGPYWVVAGVYLTLVSGSLGRALAEPVRGLAAQLWTQTKALVFYAHLLVVPRGLSVEHAFEVSESAWDIAVLLALGALVSVVVVALLSLRSDSLIGFWLAWMPLVLLPTLVVPLNVLVNEHRLYPVMVAAAVLFIRAMGTTKPAWGVPVVGVLVIFLGILAYQRTHVWVEALTLWSDASAKAPGMPRPYLFIGDAHFQAGRHEEALAAYAAAEQVNPQHLTDGDRLALANNRGAALLALGRHGEAMRSYEAALRIVPDYEPAVVSLDALRALEGGRRPRAEVLKRRGLTAMVAGDLAAAEQALRASLEVQQDGSTSLALGLVLERRQKWLAATELYRRLIQVSPNPTIVTSARRRLAQLPEVEGAR
ncbi:MAG: tetratricopeptide repeat protein [Candidatus Latescibacterota bacterium]